MVSPPMRICLKHLILCLFVLVMFTFGNIGESYAASPAQVKQAISRGAGYLQSGLGKSNEGAKTLGALALMKAGVPKNSPIIHEIVEDILKRFDGDKYKPGGEHFYEAGVEATLLADLDPVKYKKQVQILADYISDNQQSNGGWDYPNGGHGEGSVGDTSLIQYACLGLWAAERIGVKVNPKVWEGVLLWHSRYQSADGGFAYCPGKMVGDGQGASTLNMAVNGVGSMHIAMLHINPNFMPLEQELKRNKPEEEKVEKPKFGILEKVELDNVTPKEVEVSIPTKSIESVRRAFNYVTTRFRVDNTETGNKVYYYYSLERMSALADVKSIGNQDWFNACADFLIKQQKPDGSWAMSKYYGADIDTAFAVLFLTRSTGKLLKRVDTPKFGDGLLAGGRGLPEDLTDVDFNGRSVKMKEKPTEPLDILLASLSKTGDLSNLDDVQDKIVEQVQLGNREDLVGQIDQLVKLVDHPDANIRQTVVWALGRTGDMNLAKYLIERLSDTDLGVMIEARNALCWISRKPLGFGFPDDPLIDLSANASQDQKNAVIAQWHKNLVLTWGEWYLKNRPFEERGDAFETELRKKMDKLKYGF